MVVSLIGTQVVAMIARFHENGESDLLFETFTDWIDCLDFFGNYLNGKVE